MNDCEIIRSAASKAKRTLVLGGGFIGMEVASVLAQKNIETTLVICGIESGAAFLPRKSPSPKRDLYRVEHKRARKG